MQNIIEVRNLTKSFLHDGQKNTVLKDINFSVKKGEFLVVMGPSGSGKSTLLYSISGMDNIDSGEVYLLGQNITSLNEKDLSSIRLNKMGFIFQNPVMLKNLNILDNIVLPAFKSHKESKESIYDRANELMEMTFIESLKERSINKVSGGELQRASICRAMINQPEILFGDEPTGALNSKTSKEIINILKNINEKGSTIILVTHDPNVAIASDRVVFMKDVEICSNLEIKDLPEEKRTLLVHEEMMSLGI